MSVYEGKSPLYPPAHMPAANATGSQRFIKRLGAAFVWQAMGKLLQIIGAAYAFRCLGPENVGLTGTILTFTAFALILSDFGIERVAVRKIAREQDRLTEITQAVFTLRFLIALLALASWCGISVSAYGLNLTGQIWILGGIYLFTGIVTSNWYFQATDNIPTFTAVQTGLSLATSVAYLLLFKRGQAVGSDLLVMTVLAAIVTVAVCIWMRRQIDGALLSLANIRSASDLLKEGHANWWFSLLYCALSTMSLPLCYWVLGEKEGGWFRGASAFVGAIQLFLNNFAFMLNPRIVAWYKEDIPTFRKRVAQLSLGAVLTGCAAFAVVWPLREWITHLLLGEDFAPSAVLLPILLFAKFLALSSGILIWGFLAGHKDNLAPRCCIAPLLAAIWLHSVLISSHGAVGVTIANVLGELLLLLVCAVAFSRAYAQPR